MSQLSRRNLMASLGMTGISCCGPNRLVHSLYAASSSEGSGEQPRYGALPLTEGARRTATENLISYFTQIAPELLRPAQGLLAHAWVAPSAPKAAYANQMWDWDTYWTSRGLFRIANLTGNRDLHKMVAYHVAGSVFNFLDSQSDGGRIATMISVNNSDFFGSVKFESPHINNQAKPVFGQIALLLTEETGNVEWLASRFDNLLAFYQAWANQNQASLGLLVCGSDVGIGDDNDPTIWGRPYFSSAHLLLNCLYYQDLLAASKLAGKLNRPQDQARLAERAKAHAGYILQYCWDPRDRFFYTVDVQCVDRRAEYFPNLKHGMSMSWKCLPMRFQMFTGFLPMWAGIATREQAEDLVTLHFLNEKSFYAAYGVRSLSMQETMYSLAKSSNPSNWLGPVWIIVNYFVWKGLKNYGYDREATVLADKTIKLLASDLAKTGTLNEYYNPDTGEPISFAGFMDWNLLVSEMMGPLASVGSKSGASVL